MVTEAGKELLRNTINTATFHNKILEENEMWKQWEKECGLTMMVSDDDILKRIRKNHQCSKHRRRDKSRNRDKYKAGKSPGSSAGSSKDRWDHSGFAELYPDGVDSEKNRSASSFKKWDHSGFAELYPDSIGNERNASTSSSFDKHKKKKKNRHRTHSSDDEILKDFKRNGKPWNKDKTLKLIECLHAAPALWDVHSKDYQNPIKKCNDLKRISTYFNVSEDEIREKICLLINEFKNGNNMLRKQSGSKPEELFDYKLLNFLTKNSCEEIRTFVDSKYTDKVIDSSDDSYSDDDEEETSTCLSSNKYSEEKHLLNARTEQSSFSPNAIKEKQIEYQAGRACKLTSSIQEDYFLYGQNIANRLYNSKQSNQAIANAKYEINHILNRLERGDFEPVQKRSVASSPK